MVDLPNNTTSLSDLMEVLSALIEAAANNRKEEVYRFAEPLCAFAGIGRSIMSASPVHDKDGSWCIDMFVRFNLNLARYAPPTSGRHCDILFFGAMLLLDRACAADTKQGFFFHPKEDKDRPRYYLRYGNGTRKPRARPYLARISVDAAPFKMVRFAMDHHTYRRRALLSQGGPGSVAPGTVGREDAIKLAVALYAKNYPDGGLEGVTVDEYETVLRALLTANDRFEDGWVSGTATGT
jgi:hypothetical protein